jgi:glycerol-3-phosphate dehydrogenase (NAD(P)+)
MAASSILIIGGGMFGRAMQSLCAHNDIVPDVVDQGEYAEKSYELVVFAAPVSAMRRALLDNRAAFEESTVVVSCSKGIEKDTCLLPHQIFGSLGLPGRYYTLAGPSFAREVMERMPTVVDIAGLGDQTAMPIIRSVLETDYFRIEEHDSVPEVELAGAMKNVYAVVAGFLAATGGGENLHAHLQVVALREYQSLATVLEGKVDVVHPSIVGDLELTSGSVESRNYRYGGARAEGEDMPNDTVEGKNTVYPLLSLAAKHQVTLPLAAAVQSIIEKGADARAEVYQALGF